MSKKVGISFIVVLAVIIIGLLLLLKPDIDAGFTSFKDKSNEEEILTIDNNIYYVESKDDLQVIQDYLDSLNVDGIITEQSFNMDVDEPPTGDVLEYQYLGRFYHINVIGGESFYAVVADGQVIKVTY